MPLVQTRGAASAQGFGEFAVVTVPNYIEDVFSCFLYTGNGSTQTITNGIDLSTKGGLVWTKVRNGAFDHSLYDSARGFQNILISNTTAGSSNASPYGLTALTTGFTDAAGWSSAYNLATWTFRKQPKFFDVVTWSGNDTGGRRISHNLGSVPGCIIVKAFNAGSTSWAVYHRSLGGVNKVIVLNSTNAVVTATGFWGTSDPTSTDFGVSDGTYVNNVSGQDYVAYLFAHDAGGFGLTGADNVISCGSYSGTGATGNAITLGYEPQWVMVKRTDTTADWEIMDAMRSGFLEANTSDAESGGSWFSLSGDNFFPTATGFQINTAGPAWNASGGTYIYIAIRRGPMKVPTSGTSVFAPVTYTGNATARTLTTNFPVDLNTSFYRPGYSGNTFFYDRLRGSSLGGGLALLSSSTAAESGGSAFGFDNNVGIGLGTSAFNGSGETYINYMMRRAPSFFDEVCYTGTGVNNQAFTHNLGAVPELMIIKMRIFSSGTGFWFVYSSTLGYANYLLLNATDASSSGGVFGNQNPDSSSFYVSNGSNINNTASQYVAYLFATCAGVSKVGSYTGTGTTLQIDCGFTGGARFVLIKRTDSTGDWYVWDSARGIVAGNDPYLLLNSTAAEVTGTDYVDTYSAGFEISSTAPAAINSNGGSFIFLAIA